MLVLGFDTSTEAAAIGLYRKGEGIIGEGLFRLPVTHSQRLMPDVDRLLKGCLVKVGEIQGIVVTKGPGSFTGIRIGMATARGLAQALSIPICGLSSLELLSHNLRFFEGPLLPMIDARGERIYTGAYAWEGDALKPLIQEGLFTPESWTAALLEKGILQGVPFGPGYLEYKDHFLQEKRFSFTCLAEDLSIHLPRGGTLARLGYMLLSNGQGVDISSVKPNYLKASQAEIALLRRGETV